jgi:hypothetical protein
MTPKGSPVLNVFPSSSQTAPKSVPQDVLNSTWVLSGMVCPKFNSHGYKLKRWYLGEHTCFNFATQDPKRCFSKGHAQCSDKIADGPINAAPFKRNLKSYEHNHHDLIHINQTISPQHLWSWYWSMCTMIIMVYSVKGLYYRSCSLVNNVLVRRHAFWRPIYQKWYA